MMMGTVDTVLGILSHTYIPVALAVLVTGLALFGWLWQQESDDWDTDLVGAALTCVIVATIGWPLLIVVAILSIPWWLGALAGKVGDMRKASREREQADEKATLIRLRDTFEPHEPEWELMDSQIKAMP